MAYVRLVYSNPTMQFMLSSPGLEEPSSGQFHIPLA